MSITGIAFQITLNNGIRLWPAKVFSKESGFGERSIQELRTIQELLEKDGCIYVQSSGYDFEGATSPYQNGLIYKTDVAYIQGPIQQYDSNDLSLDEVFSLSEAANEWGMKDGATIRKAIERDKFFQGEVRKSESVHLITYAAMQRVFGAVPPDKHKEIPFVFISSAFIEEVRLLPSGEIQIFKIPVKITRKSTIPYDLIPAYESFPGSLIIDKLRFFDNLRMINYNSNQADYNPKEDRHNGHLADALLAVKEAYSSDKKVYMFDHKGYQQVEDEKDIELILESPYMGWGEIDKDGFLSMLNSVSSEILGMPKIINFKEVSEALSINI